jgi:hypothetical protein
MWKNFVIFSLLLPSIALAAPNPQPTDDPATKLERAMSTREATIRHSIKQVGKIGELDISRWSVIVNGGPPSTGFCLMSKVTAWVSSTRYIDTDELPTIRAGLAELAADPQSVKVITRDGITFSDNQIWWTSANKNDRIYITVTPADLSKLLGMLTAE